MKLLMKQHEATIHSKDVEIDSLRNDAAKAVEDMAEVAAQQSGWASQREADKAKQQVKRLRQQNKQLEATLQVNHPSLSTETKQVQLNVER